MVFLHRILARKGERKWLGRLRTQCHTWPKASASSTRDPRHFTGWLPDPMITDLLEMTAVEVGFREYCSGMSVLVNTNKPKPFRRLKQEGPTSSSLAWARVSSEPGSFTQGDVPPTQSEKHLKISVHQYAGLGTAGKHGSKGECLRYLWEAANGPSWQ